MKKPTRATAKTSKARTPARAAGAAGYSGTPLPKKLMIRDGDVVALVDAPDGFEKTLGPLPTGAVVRRAARGGRQVTIWFVQTRRDLERRLGLTAKAVGDGKLWLAWPKKSSGVVTDVTEDVVRNVGLANGLVDYKVCAIDATWSGLLFARRK